MGVLQVAQLAGDNRLGIIALLFVPVVGWVGFNILQPALNQLDAMSQSGGKKVATKKRGVAVGLALTAASLLYGESANAVNEVSFISLCICAFWPHACDLCSLL
jgi:Photosystem II protein Y (PsbY)